MKKSIIKIVMFTLVLGFTLSGCDLFSDAKDAAQKALEEPDPTLLATDGAAETDECKDLLAAYGTLQDETILKQYKQKCLKSDTIAAQQAVQSRPPTVEGDDVCAEKYDRAYLLADSIYFENAEMCDFNEAKKVECDALMEPVKVLLRDLINTCGVPQSEIYVRRFREPQVIDYTNCSFPMFIPEKNESVEVKCQESPIQCETKEGKQVERWESVTGEDVFVPCPKNCSEGQFFDPATNECVYDKYQGYETACMGNQYLSQDGTCKNFIACPQGQWFDTYEESCVVDEWWCPEGFYKPYQGAECKQDVWSIPCDSNMYRDAAGNCVEDTYNCNWDEFFDSNTNSCVKQVQCAPNQAFSYSKGECVTFQDCGMNEWFDIEMGICQQNQGSVCADGEVFQYTTGACVTMQNCEDGQFFDIERGECRVDDKPFNDMVTSNLSPYCSDLYQRMNGDNSEDMAFKDFLSNCLDEFTAITMPQGDEPQCQPLYQDIMEIMGDYFSLGCEVPEGTTAPAGCDALGAQMEPKMTQFKELMCAEKARTVDPFWVFLPESGGDDNGSQQAPQCPQGTHWDDMSKYCMTDDMGGGCPMGEYYDSMTDSCKPNSIDNQCQDGSYYDSNTQSCEPNGTFCNAGEIKLYDKSQDMDTCILESEAPVCDAGVGITMDPLGNIVCEVDAGEVIQTRLTPACQELFIAIDTPEAGTTTDPNTGGSFNVAAYNTFIASCDAEFRASAIDPQLTPACSGYYNDVIDAFSAIAGGECAQYMEGDSPVAPPEVCQTQFQAMDTAEGSLISDCPEAFTNPDYPYIFN